MMDITPEEIESLEVIAGTRDADNEWVQNYLDRFEATLKKKGLIRTIKINEIKCRACGQTKPTPEGFFYNITELDYRICVTLTEWGRSAIEEKP